MTKLKMIIVDDEMLIRKLIRMKLDAAGREISIVGEYADAAGALADFDALRPDLVLSDICMPGEDGITFAEKCVRQNPGCRVIIITGFNDFDYARRSLKAGVYDYLMKPVNGEELNETVRRACEEIRRQREEEERKQRLMDHVRDNLPALRDLYLNRLLLQEEPEAETEERLLRYEVEVNRTEDGALILAMIVLREVLERPELLETLRREAEDFFRSERYIRVLVDQWGRLLIISNSASFPLYQCVQLLLSMLEEKYDCHLHLGLSKTFGGWRDLGRAYKDVLGAVLRSHGSRRMEEEERTEEPEKRSQQWRTIEHLIEERRFEEARAGGRELIPQRLGVINEETLSLFGQRLCADAGIGGEDLLCWTYLTRCRTAGEVARWIDCFMTELILLRFGNEEAASLVRQVLAYMEEHLGDPEMNLNTIAELHRVSSGHLSRLIKQYTGKNYGDLLSDLRLLRMLCLMNVTAMKDREIGCEIGICDAHYLSIWFRKMTGISVSAYRKKSCQQASGSEK